MAPLKVYHRPGAGRPVRVVWALEEAGADYEVVVLTPEQGKGEEHLARQPLGRVPALEDEQGPLFESTSLCFHVAELYPDSGLLPPAGSHERAVAQQWSIFPMTELEPPAIEYYRFRETNPEASAKAAKRCEKAAAALEGALVGAPAHIGLERFTVADIIASEVLRILGRLGAVAPSSTVQAYLDEMAARPARERAVARLAA